jgi:cytochrome c oxidase cbb3-type subunit 4
MDLNDIRSATTLFSFVVFIGIVVWAWAGKRRAAFDEAAQLPFLDTAPGNPVVGEQK